MDFSSLDALKEAGFCGFHTVSEMKDGLCQRLLDFPGVYIIFRYDDTVPKFLEVGSGGFFKGKDPNVSIDELQANWVPGAHVVYIGKATSLKKRLGQYMRFGDGKNVGHWGGRYIWQLADADDLIVCTKLTEEDPRAVEADLIQDFISQYGQRPFANLKD